MTELLASRGTTRLSITAAKRVRIAAIAAFTGSLIVIAALGASNGGYFSESWGWPSLVFAWAVALALLVRDRVVLRPLELVFGGSVAALAAWYLASAAWAGSASGAVYESERVLVYATGVLAVLLVFDRRDVPLILAGVLGGIFVVDVYALGTRLLPDRLGTYDPTATYRLATPIGYWNGLAIFSVIGVLLALGFVARGRTLARTLSAGTLPVLLATLYFTFSRGPWIALAIGLLASFLLTRAKSDFLAALLLAVPAALVVWLASRSHALATQGSPIGAVAHDGHRVAVEVAVATLFSGCLGLAYAHLHDHVDVPRWAAVSYDLAWAGAVAAAAVVVLVHFGGPASAARKAWHSFTSPPVRVQQGTKLENRLFSLSSNGRIALWRGAWHEAKAHPVLGGGAGSYEEWWLQHRRTPLQVRDAHSLYLETLAELGPLGLALLVLALGAPLVGAVRARTHPFVAGAGGAYLAYVVHAAADWDWELTAVTLAALVCGGAILLAGRDREAGISLGLPARVGVLVPTLLVIAAAFYVLLANVPLRAAETASAAGDWAKEVREAQKAQEWAPWSAEAYFFEGEGQLAQGNVRAAARALRIAAGKDPGNWLVWYDLAGAESGAAATQALARARQLNPLAPEISAGP